jgi:GMP synthase PP-ATPase subunit
LRVLDFQKVKLKEKLMAKNLFESEKGKQLIEDMKNKKFQIEEDEEYVKELEKTLKDEEKKRKIYVRNLLQLLFLSLKFY